MPPGPDPLDSHPRIAIVGTSGSGKTTLARALAATLARPHLELDALHWGPAWTTRPDFRERVRAAVAADAWIADGNYGAVRDLVWTRATAIVWLNYPFPLVFRRAVNRTVRRIASREILFGGNRETIREGLLGFDGIPLWVLRTFRRRRREVPRLLRLPAYRHLDLFECRSPAEARRIVSPGIRARPGALPAAPRRGG